MAKFRHKPTMVEAVQFGGDGRRDKAWTWARERRAGREIEAGTDDRGHFLLIQTLEGTMRADDGDWIIQGIRGELYPVKPDIFEQTYERVE